MIPAFLMLFGYKNKHQLFTPGKRSAIVGVATIGFLVYCISNYVWDIPKVDFRPFANGVDINAKKAAEVKAAEEAPITYVLTNRASGAVEEMPMNTLSLIHISEPTRRYAISYAVFCLKKKK